MIKSWSVIVIIEHEWDQGGGVAVTEMKVSRVVDGNDSNCDALWAAIKAVDHIRDIYNIPTDQAIHVTQIAITECE